MNLPNVITVTRILLIPVFIVLYMLQKDWSIFAASVLFALAAITDWLDGYLARRLDQTTPFGAFLDPVADKLIVVAALIILVAYHNNPWLTLPSLIIVGREIVISALREWMAEVNDSVAVAVSYLGKIKTTLQMIALTLLLSQPVGNDSSALQIGYILLYLAAVMTLWSMWQYLQAAGTGLAERCWTGRCADTLHGNNPAWRSGAIPAPPAPPPGPPADVCPLCGRDTDDASWAVIDAPHLGFFTISKGAFTAAHQRIRVFNRQFGACASDPKLEDSRVAGVPFDGTYRHADWELTVPLLLTKVVWAKKFPGD